MVEETCVDRKKKINKIYEYVILLSYSEFMQKRSLEFVPIMPTKMHDYSKQKEELLNSVGRLRIPVYVCNVHTPDTGIFHCDSLKYDVMLHWIKIKHTISRMEMPHLRAS